MQPLASSAQPVIVLHIFPRIIVSDLFLLDNHGITHTALDYRGWQADMEVITIHLLIPILFYENERIFSPAITPLTASHFQTKIKVNPVFVLSFWKVEKA